MRIWMWIWINIELFEWKREMSIGVMVEKLIILLIMILSLLISRFTALSMHISTFSHILLFSGQVMSLCRHHLVCSLLSFMSNFDISCIQMIIEVKIKFWKVLLRTKNSKCEISESKCVAKDANEEIFFLQAINVHICF